MMLTLAACGTTRLADAYGDKARADQVGTALGVADDALADARRGWRMPKECEARFRIGAQPGDGYDVVGKKADLALGRANARLAHCTALANRQASAWEKRP